MGWCGLLRFRSVQCPSEALIQVHPMVQGICSAVLASLSACLLHFCRCHVLLLIFRETHWPGLFSPPPARKIWEARISSHVERSRFCVGIRGSIGRRGDVGRGVVRMAFSMPTSEEKAKDGQHFPAADWSVRLPHLITEEATSRNELTASRPTLVYLLAARIPSWPPTH